MKKTKLQLFMIFVESTFYILAITFYSMKLIFASDNGGNIIISSFHHPVPVEYG